MQDRSSKTTGATRIAVASFHFVRYEMTA